MSPADVAPVTTADPFHKREDRTSEPFDHPRTVFRDPAYQRTIQEIDRLRHLAQGWDSYGAKRIDPEARANAVRVVTMLGMHIDEPIAPPIVGPSVEGGVILRWESNDREVVVKLLSKGGEYHVARRDEDSLMEEGEIGRPEGVVTRLRRFLAQQ